jgi:hypothetical protein
MNIVVVELRTMFDDGDPMMFGDRRDVMTRSVRSRGC